MFPALLKQGRLLRTTAGLEPYTGPFGRREAAHLLRRTIFAPRWQEITLAVQNGLDWTVNQLIDNTLPLPAPPGDWANQPSYPRPLTSDQQTDERIWMNEIRAWWLRLMTEQGISIREKLTLFWHDHFANEAVDIQRPQWMYGQNVTFRKMALGGYDFAPHHGSFERLLNTITIDPAMLYYLDGRLNTRTRPNENWAREVMELFTLGEGHYTEEDVQEAARAYTGWTVVNDVASFDLNSRYDSGIKTILGVTGQHNYTAANEILLQHPDSADPDVPLCAKFICRKLYKYFVYETPDEAVVRGLALTLRDSGEKPYRYQVGPVLRQLFTSAHFFDASHYGAVIREPLDHIAGVLRQMAVTDARYDRAVIVSEGLGQKLLDPPDVSGWPGYHHWISTSTLPQRHDFTNDLLSGFIQNSNYPLTIDVLNNVAFPTGVAGDANQLIDTLAEYLLPFPLTADLKTSLLNTLLDGTTIENWTPYAPGAGTRVANVLRVILALPEYQLA